MSNKTEHIKKRKALMIKALHKHRGLITYACKAAKIGRTTYYDWIHKDQIFAKEANAVQDYMLDIVENIAFQLIEEKNPTMVIFYLKTKGKKRGYVERQTIEYKPCDLSAVRDIMNTIDKSYEREY